MQNIHIEVCTEHNELHVKSSGQGNRLTWGSSDVEEGVHASVKVVGGAALHQPRAHLIQHHVLLVHAPWDELQRLLALILRSAPHSSPSVSSRHPTNTSDP